VLPRNAARQHDTSDPFFEIFRPVRIYHPCYGEERSAIRRRPIPTHSFKVVHNFAINFRDFTTDFLPLATTDLGSMLISGLVMGNATRL
jgi:hypothetical protein